MSQALRRFAALSIVLLLTACVPAREPRLSGPLPPLSPGMARLVFYRTLQFYDTTAMTTVYLNGTPVGVSQVGSVFFQDVVPGQYDITVFSPGSYPNQFKSVVVSAGNVVYARIDRLPRPPCPAGRFVGTCPPDTFIVTIVDPAAGFQQVQGLQLLAG